MPQRRRDRQEDARSEQEYRATEVIGSAAAREHTGRNIRLIIGREFRNRVSQRSFVISSILLIAVVAIAAFVPTIVQYIGTRTTAPASVVVVNNAGTVAGLGEAALASAINASLNGMNTAGPASYAITFQPPASQDSLQEQVKSGKLDVLLALNRAPNQELQFAYYSDASSTSDSNLPRFQALATQLTFLDTAHRLNLTPAQTQSLSAPPSLTVV
jgi:ABC-2 type transport system permease protein